MEPKGICKNCKINSMCIRCWGTNYAATGSIYKTDSWACVVNRIILLAGAKIIYNSLINKSDLNDSEQRQMKGIQFLINELFNEENTFLREYDI